jgi:hypothetical protein
MGLARQHAELRERIASWIESLWDARTGHLLMGPESYDNALDVAGNLGSYFLRRRGRVDLALRSLSTSQTLFATRSFDGSVKGFGDILGPWTVNGEWGVGQYAAAGGPHANFVLNEYLDLHPNGGLMLGSPDEFSADFLSFNTPTGGVATTAWIYHAIDGQLLRVGVPRATPAFSRAHSIAASVQKLTGKERSAQAPDWGVHGDRTGAATTAAVLQPTRVVGARLTVEYPL